MLFVILNRKIKIRYIGVLRKSFQIKFETRIEEKRNKKLEKFFEGGNN